VAQKQDLSIHTGSIQTFAERVGSLRPTNRLGIYSRWQTLGCTSPQSWNALERELLEDLYQLTSHRFGWTGRFNNTVYSKRIEEGCAPHPIERFGSMRIGRRPFWAKARCGRIFCVNDATVLLGIPANCTINQPRINPVVQARPIGSLIAFQVMVYTNEEGPVFLGFVVSRQTANSACWTLGFTVRAKSPSKCG